jgi:hypothetical protein
MKAQILGIILLMVLPLKAENFPAELNVYLEKENSLLKVYLTCYNPTLETLDFKVSLKIIKKGPSGTSNVLQSKRIILSPKEKIKPMLGLLKIGPEDFYTIEVKVWNKERRLILEKTICSENER